MRVSVVAMMLVVSPLVIAGCSVEKFPETYPVTGILTFEDKPVEGASISLVPKGMGGHSAGATTDAEGKFSVTTYFSAQAVHEGAASGEYAITVSKKSVQAVPEGTDSEDPQELMAAFMKNGPPKDLLPITFQSPETTTLSVSVNDTPPEPLDLNLGE